MLLVSNIDITDTSVQPNQSRQNVASHWMGENEPL